MFFSPNIFGWLTAGPLPAPRAASVSPYLRKVQQTFQTVDLSQNMERFLLIFGVIAALLLFLLVLRRILKQTQTLLANPNMDRVVHPRQIRGIIRRSIDLRGVYDLEVYDPSYRQIYKCMPLGLNSEGQIEMDVSAYTDPNLDFADKRVRVAFRMARRGRQEFYNFETQSRGIGYTTTRGYREKAIRLEIPELITLGQKRRFVRVEPRGPFAISLNIVRPSSPKELIPLKQMKLLAKAEVEDISIGGIKAKLVRQMTKLDLRPNDIIYLHFNLPVRELGLENMPADFFLAASVVACETPPDAPSSQKQLRLMFVERGSLNAVSRSVSFRPATWMSFEDLSHWIQAYQRFLLKEARDTASRPEALFNIYAAPNGAGSGTEGSDGDAPNPSEPMVD